MLSSTIVVPAARGAPGVSAPASLLPKADSCLPAMCSAQLTEYLHSTFTCGEHARGLHTRRAPPMLHTPACLAAANSSTAAQAFRAISTELQGEEHSKWLKKYVHRSRALASSAAQKAATLTHVCLPPSTPHSVVDTYPVKDIEHFEYSLEFMLGVPMPVHQFDLPPILVEVKNRNPDVDMDFH